MLVQASVSCDGLSQHVVAVRPHPSPLLRVTVSPLHLLLRASASHEQTMQAQNHGVPILEMSCMCWLARVGYPSLSGHDPEPTAGQGWGTHPHSTVALVSAHNQPTIRSGGSRSGQF